MSSPGPVIVVREVAVVIGEEHVLAPTSLEVASGEAVAVMGPSGSGKSTLLACIDGLRAPTAGTVQVGERVVSGLSVAARARFRRELCGVVHQDPDLLDELDVRDNVALPLIFAGTSRPAARARALEMLVAVGCGELSSRRPWQISGGEAQRVAVARAFAGAPAVIVADEPTASLDAANAATVIDLIVTHARRAGAAAVIATHDPAVAEACDHVLPLRRGTAVVGGVRNPVSAR